MQMRLPLRLGRNLSSALLTSALDVLSPYIFQSGPIEVSISNPSFRRYKTCLYDLEMQTIKGKILQPDPLPQLPTFELAAADDIEAQSWEELDGIVHKGNSFEASCAMAVIGLNGRHTVCTACNGTRYLSGYVQDKQGTIRYLSVFGHIPAFLKAIPADVSRKPAQDI